MRSAPTVHGGHNLALLEGAQAWFPALIRELDAAHTQVQIETYILDVTGEGESVPFRTGHFYGMTTHARGGLFLEPGARGVVDIVRR